VFFYIQQIQK